MLLPQSLLALLVLGLIRLLGLERKQNRTTNKNHRSVKRPVSPAVLKSGTGGEGAHHSAAGKLGAAEKRPWRLLQYIGTFELSWVSRGLFQPTDLHRIKFEATVLTLTSPCARDNTMLTFSSSCESPELWYIIYGKKGLFFFFCKNTMEFLALHSIIVKQEKNNLAAIDFSFFFFFNVSH